MIAQDGTTVLFDSATDQLRIEKSTGPTGNISYKLYPYYGGKETGRDVANRGTGEGIVTEAASIEDLIYLAFDGDNKINEIFAQ